MAPSHAKPRLFEYGADKKQKRMIEPGNNSASSASVWKHAPTDTLDSVKDNNRNSSKDKNRKRKGFVVETNGFKQHKPSVMIKDEVEDTNPERCPSTAPSRGSDVHFEDLSNVTLAFLANMDDSEDEEGDGTAQRKRKASRDAEACGLKRKGSQDAELYDAELWVAEQM